MSSFEIALHEIGHSIARLLIDGEAAAAAVSPDPNAAILGWCGGALGVVPDIADFTTAASEEKAKGLGFEACFRRAVVVEAGHAAIAVYNRTAFLPLTFSHGDTRESSALAHQALPDGDQSVWNAFVGMAYRFAVCLLSRRFGAVVHVSTVLEKKGRMTGPQIAKAYAEALKQSETAVE